MARAGMQCKLKLSISIHRFRRLMKNPRAEAIAEDIIVRSCQMERGAGIATSILWPREQSEELGDGEGLLSGLGEVHGYVVVVGSLEVVQDLGVSVHPC